MPFQAVPLSVPLHCPPLVVFWSWALGPGTALQVWTGAVVWPQIDAQIFTMRCGLAVAASVCQPEYSYRLWVLKLRDKVEIIFKIYLKITNKK